MDWDKLNQIVYLCLLLGFLVSCAREFEVPDGEQAGFRSIRLGPTVVIENEGLVCFRYPRNLHRLQGRFHPKGCFSSSCTEVVEDTLHVELDADQFAIRLTTNFVLMDPHSTEPHLCTTDCGGADSVYFSQYLRQLGRVDKCFRGVNTTQR